MRGLLAVGVLLGCMGGGAEARPGVRTIRYETSPCFGACPVYTVIVSSDGRGTFEGGRFTAAAGTRRFRVRPAQFAEFSRRLRADHPRGSVDLAEPANCGGRFATDMPGVEVTWSGAQRPGHLRVNYGCNREANARMFRALRSAPEALPIAGFIGPPRIAKE